MPYMVDLALQADMNNQRRRPRQMQQALSDLMEEPIVGSKVEIIDSEAPVNGMERRRPP